MRELWVWRTLTLAAAIGWGATTWVLWPEEPPGPTEVTSTAEARPEHPERRRRVFEPDSRGPVGRKRGPPAVPMAPAVAPVGEVSEEALEIAREQVREEWRARREAGAEERLDRALEDIATFVKEHELDEDTHVALEAAVTDMHTRMRDLFASRSDNDDEATHENRREQFRASVEKMEADAAAVLPEDLMDPFLEQVRGGPPRGGRFR
jgi:hypothetical protein